MSATGAVAAQEEESAISIQLPADLTPEAIETIDKWIADLGRRPDWDAIETELSGREATPVVRYTRAAVAFGRRSVWTGALAERDMRALADEVAARGDRESQILSAHLIFAIGRGLVLRGHPAAGLKELKRAVAKLRRLRHPNGLTRALLSTAGALIQKSRRPWDALDILNELVVVAHEAGLPEYRKDADRLFGEWSRQLDMVDDFFGRAKQRLQTFAPALGIPNDADLMAVVNGVLLMNGDTDDQVTAAAPELVRFDGSFVRSMKLPSDTLELRGTTLDDGGKLWAATNRGLYSYDGQKFTQFVNPNLADEESNDLKKALARQSATVEKKTIPLRSNVINEVKQGPDGRLFLASFDGVAIFDPTAEKLEFITSEQAPIPKMVERVAPVPDGSLVIAWRDEFAVRDTKGRWKRMPFEFPALHGKQGGYLFGLLVDREGAPWVHGLYGGLRLSGHHITRVVDGNFSPTTRSVNHVIQAEDGSWWFASPNGVCIQEGQHCSALNSSRWLTAEWALDLLEWPAGDIWVSVYQGGLYRLMAPSYEHFGVEDGFVQPMNTTVAELHGKLFFSHPYGLTRLDPKTGQIDNFMAGNEGMPNQSGFADLALRLSNDLIATSGRGALGGKGVMLFDGKHSVMLGPDAGLRDERIAAICEQKPGVLLLGYLSGFVQLDTKLRQARPVDELKMPEGVQLADLICAPGQEVWALTSDQALYRLRDKSFQAIDLTAAGLDGKPVSVINSRSAGRFVIGERGILQSDREGFSALALDPDRFDFRVRYALRDESGRLYFSTESGVYASDGECWTKLTKEDGLIADTSFEILSYGDRLWITGQGGVTAFSWPKQLPPETFIDVEKMAYFRDPEGLPRVLHRSDGVEKEGWVLLKSLAGHFELPEAEAGPFLPVRGLRQPPVGLDLIGQGPLGPFAVNRLTVTFSGLVPYFDDSADELSYLYRLDEGPWTRADGRTVELTDLSDGQHRLEVRATDRRLVRDPTPARVSFIVDTPVPPWQLASVGVLFVALLLVFRKRLLWTWRLLRHRRFKPIDPSPFHPNRPAEEAQFLNRQSELESLDKLVGGGGVAVVWGARGTGKHSLMKALGRRLAARECLVLEVDLAEVAAGADVAATVRFISDRLKTVAAQRGIAFESIPSLGDSLDGDDTDVPGSNTPPTGSSASGERNAFSQLSRYLDLLERGHPDLGVSILLVDAEVLGLSIDADAAYGSYLFPFLRSAVRLHTNLSLVFCMEGRWFELAKRFEQLMVFATPVPLEPFGRAIGRELVSRAFSGRALLSDRQQERLVDLAGGNPYLLHLLGDKLVAALNEHATNLGTDALVEEAADGVVADTASGLKNTWLSLERDERLMVVALAEPDEIGQTLAIGTLVERLAAKGGEMLFEEARRALLALSKGGLVSLNEDVCRLRGGLLHLWIQRHHSIESVLEESQEYVGQYQLLNQLGAGGMGMVHKARDMIQGGLVAIKLLRPELGENKRSRRRFLREARLGKRLKHPGLVRILDYGDQGGRLYLAMEYVEGVTLSSWIRTREGVTFRQVVEIGVHLASALRAIHRMDVVHRDVKSENIMIVGASAEEGRFLYPGSIKLMDFGLAVGDDVSRMTRAGSLLGTLAYMSPEQARGKEVDARSDLYSLGAVLYELCAGRPPFSGSETVILNAVLNDQPADLPDICPGIPKDLATLIHDLLRKTAALRPETAAVVEHRLSVLAEGLDGETGAPVPDDQMASLDRTVVPAGEGGRSNLLEHRSGMVSRTLEALRLESAMLTSLSSVADRDTVDSFVGGIDATRVLLYRVSAEIASGRLDDDKLAAVLKQSIEVLGAERGLMALPDKDGTLQMHCALGRAIVDLKVLTTAAHLISECTQKRMGLLYGAEQDKLEDDDMGSAVCVPIWAGEKILGGLLLDRRGLEAKSFVDGDLEALACIGYLVGLGLERDRLYDQVLDQERLAAAGHMLAGVAHDIRNPIAVVYAASELIAAEEDAGEREQYCETIRRQVDEINEMVGNLLAFVKGDKELRPSDFSLGDLAKDVRDTLGVQCQRRGIELMVEAEGQVARVDLARAKRIIYNLGRNALEAMGNSGGKLQVRLEESDGGLRMRITDTGPGIPDQLRDSLFDPFVTSGKSGGTGLGLAIVKRFVDDHQGQIAFDCQADQGTTFDISLPKA